jgi:16S rRNA (guanine1207-N2)-methyltransferase
LRRFDVSALICEQGFKPFSDALQRAGLQVREEPEADDGERFDLVLVLPPRQRDERARCWHARWPRLRRAGAWSLARPTTRAPSPEKPTSRRWPVPAAC